MEYKNPIPDAELDDALDDEFAAEFAAWCEATGVEANEGTLEEFLELVNGDSESVPSEIQPYPFGGS